MPFTRSLSTRALLAGLAAGMRSMTPLGVLASEHDDRSIHGCWKHWPVLRSGTGRKILQLAWLGELVGDKLPTTPSRLNPGSLGGRMVLGGLAGLAVGTEGKGRQPGFTAALLGIIGAVAGSYGGYHARTFLTQKTGLPDLPGALMEDATAYIVARKAVKG